MTVANDTHLSGPYAGNGATTAFPYGFLVHDSAALKVYVTDAAGVETLAQIDTDYTVSGIGVGGGGTVTFLVAPVSGESVTVLLDQPLTQQSDYQTEGAFDMENVERDFDNATLQSKTLARELGRTIKMTAQASSTPPTLSAPEADKILAFDDTGTKIVPTRTLTAFDADIALAATAAGSAASAEAWASSAASAASAAETASQSVDAASLNDNHAAAIRQSADNAAPTFPGIVPEAHIRASKVFTPGGATLHHVYRPTDSGAVHFNASSSGEVVFDLKHLGVGQTFTAAVRHGGTGTIVIDPGADVLGVGNIIGPFAIGQKVRIGEGEGITIAARSTNTDGGMIADVVAFHPNLSVEQGGSTFRLIENRAGLFDGQSVDNTATGSDNISAPSGFMVDTANPQWSYPSITPVENLSSDVAPPYVDLPDRVYDLTSLVGTFTIGETVTCSNGASLKVELIYADGINKVGLDEQSGARAVATDTLTGDTSGATAVIDTVTTIADFVGGEIGITVFNPYPTTIKSHIHWHNLEKIS